MGGLRRSIVTVMGVWSWLVSAGFAGDAPDPADADLPGGYTLRAELSEQFLLGLPDAWTVYRQPDPQSVQADPRYGVVIFTADPMVPAAGFVTPSPAVLAGIDSGATPAFFVDRRPAVRGMGCDGFSRKATYDLGTSLASQANRGARRLFGALEPRHRSVTLGGCTGLAYRFDSGGWITDVRAVSDGDTLYLFSLRKPQAHEAGSREAFDVAMASLRLTGRSPR